MLDAGESDNRRSVSSRSIPLPRASLKEQPARCFFDGVGVAEEIASGFGIAAGSGGEAFHQRKPFVQRRLGGWLASRRFRRFLFRDAVYRRELIDGELDPTLDVGYVRAASRLNKALDPGFVDNRRDRNGRSAHVHFRRNSRRSHDVNAGPIRF